MSLDRSARAGVVGLLVLVAGLVLLTWMAQSRASAVETRPSASGEDRIRVLRVERRDLLRMMKTAMEVNFQKNRVSSEELATALLELQNAELDLCTTAQERIRVHEQMVETMRWCETIADSRYKSGRTLQMESLRAKAGRLKAEIELEQARLAAGSVTKASE